MIPLSISGRALHTGAAASSRAGRASPSARRAVLRKTSATISTTTKAFHRQEETRKNKKPARKGASAPKRAAHSTSWPLGLLALALLPSCPLGFLAFILE